MPRAHRFVVSAALALTVVAATACGGDSDGIVEKAGATTVEDWIVEADAICTASNPALDRLELPPSEPTLLLTRSELQSWAEYIGEVVAIHGTVTLSLEELGTPSGDVVEPITTYLELRADRTEREEAALDAARAGNSYEFRVTYDEIGAASADTAAAAEAAGLRICALDQLDTPIEPGDDQPSLDEWSTQVSELCTEQSDTLDEQQDPYEDIESLDDITAADLPELAGYTRSLHELTTATIEAIAELGLPVDAEADTEEYFETMDTILDGLDQMATAAEDGDLNGFREGYRDIAAATPELNDILTGLDIEECAL